MSNSKQAFEEQYREATRDAELGIGQCRVCHARGPFQRFITVLYGGGVLYCLCTHCAAQGNEIRVARGSRGIEVYGRASGGALLVGGNNGSSLGVLNKRL